ncbi:MAG: hypothetical protein KKD01_19655 [Proteobacteria bacterium]|nr:hypothetical protein [Pseudomonadota bacterium]MBU1456937.1 hypothetical protein [Pseudomonadota bacterium]
MTNKIIDNKVASSKITAIDCANGKDTFVVTQIEIKDGIKIVTIYQQREERIELWGKEWGKE